MFPQEIIDSLSKELGVDSQSLENMVDAATVHLTDGTDSDGNSPDRSEETAAAKKNSSGLENSNGQQNSGSQSQSQDSSGNLEAARTAAPGRIAAAMALAIVAAAVMVIMAAAAAAEWITRGKDGNIGTGS